MMWTSNVVGLSTATRIHLTVIVVIKKIMGPIGLRQKTLRNSDMRNQKHKQWWIYLVFKQQ